MTISKNNLIDVMQIHFTRYINSMCIIEYINQICAFDLINNSCYETNETTFLYLSLLKVSIELIKLKITKKGYYW